MFQSQLDFQKELSRQESEKAAAKSSKVKKKGITVPLTEFNALLLNVSKYVILTVQSLVQNYLYLNAILINLHIEPKAGCC